MGWVKYKIKDFLKQYRVQHIVQDDVEYKQVSILNDGSVVLRGLKIGKEIGRKRQFKIDIVNYPNTLIFTRQLLLQGSIGIASEIVDDCIVTENMPMFSIDTNKIDKDFLVMFLKSEVFKSRIRRIELSGSAQKSIHERTFLDLEFFFPNIIKQKALVEDLLTKNTAGNNISIEINNQLSLVKQLRQAFLSEAMQGKLVSKSELIEDHETGLQLLARIKAEKVQLVKDKKLKKEKKLPPIKPEEIPFEIPKDWAWCRFNDISDTHNNALKAGPFGSSLKKEFYTKTGYKIYGQEQVISDNPFYGNYYISEERFKMLKSCEVKTGDILISLVGTMGRVLILPENIEKGIINPRLVKISLFEEINRKFIKYFLYSKTALSQIKFMAHGSTMEIINLGILRQIFIPLPPINEQAKIVEKLDDLMKTCDDLENSIKQSQLQNEQLLQQILKEALEVSEEATMDTVLAQPKIVELEPTALNLDKLVAEPFEKYVAKPTNNIKDYDLEMAIMIACMKNKLGVTYGDVGLQKNVYNTNNLNPIFSKQYQFLNSNFGTYSYELKEDLKKNPYLITQKVAGDKEVYTINPKYNRQILDKLTAPENKGFVQSINRMLSIYEHPFINKETDKIELYNTVLKLSLDKNTKDIEVIYQAMKDWKINQAKYKTKAEKFNKSDTKKMLELLVKEIF